MIHYSVKIRKDFSIKNKIIVFDRSAKSNHKPKQALVQYRQPY